MLKIFDNYYLDASSVCYVLKKAHVKGDGKLEYDVCTYHTRLEEALAEAVRRGLRHVNTLAILVSLLSSAANSGG